MYLPTTDYHDRGDSNQNCLIPSVTNLINDLRYAAPSTPRFTDFSNLRPNFAS